MTSQVYSLLGYRSYEPGNFHVMGLGLGLGVGVRVRAEGYPHSHIFPMGN